MRSQMIHRSDMVNHKKWMYLILGLLLSLLSYLPCTDTVNQQMLQGVAHRGSGQQMPSAPSYTPHEPITIKGNVDFEDQGWPGSGTEEDPYVIERLNIKSSSTGINVTNTDVHFVIRNCLISAPSPSSNNGIAFYNVTHGAVMNCVIERHSAGISLSSSPDCVLTNNTASNNYSGFSVRSSSGCNLTSNVATSNSWHGFHIRLSSNLTLTSNIALNNSGYGLYFTDIRSCTLTSNIALNNSDSGFMLVRASSCTLIDNTAINHTGVGFEFINSKECTSTGNTAGRNGYGIALVASFGENLFFLNRLYENTESNGLDSSGSNHWDNGTHGNYWDDYDGVGVYLVPGSAESVDNHPYPLDNLPPTIDSPADIQYEQGTTGHAITWSPSDLNPHSYVIYQNETLVRAGPWNATSENITISVDGLPVGAYSFTLVVTDILGNTANDTALVTVVDTTPPTLDRPADIVYEVGTTGHTIVWTPEDLNPHSYTIYRDETLLRSGAWNASSETIIISVDGLTVGTYIYTIVVYDAYGNSVLNSVTVNVVHRLDFFLLLAFFLTILGAAVSVYFGMRIVLHHRRMETS